MEILTASGRAIPCGEVQWRTRTAGAGTLTFFTTESGIAPGEAVRFTAPDTGSCIFDGFVFSSEQSERGSTVTACDRLRYLLYKDTKVFSGKTAAGIVREICGERGLPMGEIADGGPCISSLIADNRPLLDIIRLAMEQSRLLGGERLCFYDDAGKLVLKEESGQMLEAVLDGWGMASAWRFTADIGTDTYNRIQLVRKNRRTGRREIFVKEDRESIARWGTLQYCAQVLQSTTDGEIAAMLEELIGQKNRVVNGIAAECIGDSRFRAGICCKVQAGGFSGRCRVLEADHLILDGYHTMKLKLEEI